jgi:hypothetical protein
MKTTFGVQPLKGASGFEDSRYRSSDTLIRSLGSLDIACWTAEGGCRYVSESQGQLSLG